MGFSSYLSGIPVVASLSCNSFMLKTEQTLGILKPDTLFSCLRSSFIRRHGMQNFWEYAEVACRVKPNFKLPISLTPLFIESQSLSCIYFSYLFLLLLSQTSGQSPDCLVCPWMKRSIWTTCIWALHLCSVSGIHCVWSWWIWCSLLWINGATASSVEHCWFPLPWDLVLQSQIAHFQLPLTVCPWLSQAGTKPWGTWPVLVYSKRAHNCNKPSLLWTCCSSSSLCLRLGDWSWLIVANVVFWDI